MTTMICIVCPRGCRLSVDEETLEVTGYGCERGAEYGRAELQNPTRVLTSTVRIRNAVYRRCPVKTERAIPKPLLIECKRALDAVELEAPVESGYIVLENVCGTGINIVTTRSMPVQK